MKKKVSIFVLSLFCSLTGVAEDYVKVSSSNFSAKDYSIEVKTFAKAKDLYSAEITAVSGHKIEYIASVGDKISAGEVVVRLDLGSLSQEIKAAELKVEELGLLLESQEKLQEKGHISDYEVLKTKTEMANAISKLKSLEVSLRDRKVVSPISGQIVAVYKNVGEKSDGDPIIEVSNMTNIISAEILSKHSGSLIQGSMARFVSVDGNEYSGQVVFISPKVNLNNSINIEVKTSEPIKPNMSGDLFLSLNPIRVLKIPSSSLVIGEGGKLFVFENSDGVAKKHSVEVISVLGKDVLIKPIGDSVNLVTQGQYYLKDNQLVEVK